MAFSMAIKVVGAFGDMSDRFQDPAILHRGCRLLRKRSSPLNDGPCEVDILTVVSPSPSRCRLFALFARRQHCIDDINKRFVLHGCRDPLLVA